MRAGRDVLAPAAAPGQVQVMLDALRGGLGIFGPVTVLHARGCGELPRQKVYSNGDKRYTLTVGAWLHRSVCPIPSREV